MKNLFKKLTLFALTLVGTAAPLQAIWFGFGFGPRRYGYGRRYWGGRRFGFGRRHWGYSPWYRYGYRYW